jgi:hypothetical protein
MICFGPSKNLICAVLTIILSHILIDFTKNVILSKLSIQRENSKTLKFVIFLADQAIHILIIIFSFHLLKGFNRFGKTLFNSVSVYIPYRQLYSAIIIVFLYMLCLSPAAAFIKEVFVLLSFEEAGGDNHCEYGNDYFKCDLKHDLINSGYLIGILERIIILTLGLNGQIGAIGFVLTAKSLARFNQLSDKNFAEKYLIGTLLSSSIAILCVTIVNYMLNSFS